MKITIDGPAGAGKSTVARMVAQRLGFTYLDTGAMYRALTLASLRQGIDLHDEDGMVSLLDKTDIRLDGGKVFLNDEDVSGAIRAPAVDATVSTVSQFAVVRAHMVSLQRQLAAHRSVVMDGRDAGTTVLPDAELKIYLEASLDARAARRARELRRRGSNAPVNSVATDLEKRDIWDQKRAVSPLRPATDAIHIDTTHLDVEAVVGEIMQWVQKRKK